MAASEWTTTEHALSYLSRADALPHRTEGEAVLLDHVPAGARRIPDLGTGDGRLIALLRINRPACHFVGVDVSEPMLAAATERLAGDAQVELLNHDLASPLPELGSFDAIVSCFAIHHLENERKRSLYEEVYELLESGGVFTNLEHVASPTDRLHEAFLAAIGYTPETEDRSNILLDVAE